MELKKKNSQNFLEYIKPTSKCHSEYQHFKNIVCYIFKHLYNFFFLGKKTFHGEENAEIAFKDFLASKLLGFYCKGINGLVTQWQKCIVFWGFFWWEGSPIFDEFKHCLNALIQE